VQPQRVKLIEGGKLIIPAPMRKALGIVPGDTVTVEVDNGELRIRSLAVALHRARAILRKHVPKGESLVSELIADRRAEAARE